MSTTYTYTVQQIIDAALRTQQWLDYTESADSTKTSQMLEAFNIMLKAWSAKGIKMWTLYDQVVPLVDGTRIYTLGPTGTTVTDRPMRIQDAFLRNLSSQTDIFLTGIALHDYTLLGDKFPSGVPTQYFYDPVLTNGKIYLFPVPNASTASTFEAHFWIRTYIQDAAALGDNAMIPAEWYRPCVFGLADQTSFENACPLELADRLSLRAKAYLEEAENWDREYVSMRIGVDTARNTPARILR